MVISDVRLWRHNLMIGSAWPQLHKQSALMALTAMFSLRNPLLVSARSLCNSLLLSVLALFQATRIMLPAPFEGLVAPTDGTALQVWLHARLW